MGERMTREVSIHVIDDDGDDIETVRLSLVIDYTPGEPEFTPHGRWTDPEHYDPGSAPEAYLVSVARIADDGTMQAADARETAWARTWLANNLEHLDVEVA